MTNDEDLQQFFDQNENAKSDIDSNQGDDVTFLNSQLKFDENKSKSVLVVEWNTKTDEFVFRFSNLVDQAKSLETTKRNVLKVSASFYDPLGMISPVTARVKTIFQLLCQGKLNWDDSVPREIEIIWNEFISSLEEWGIIKVKRFAFFEIRDKIYSVQLHGFCDSSSQIYCAVIYSRIVTHFGIRVSFLAAKTKVTSFKKLSIPRLELLACVLLSKLLGQVKASSQGRVFINELFCWIDSKVALCWIKGMGKCWRPWVENKVVNLRKVVDRERWFHVSGVFNPADILTRVCNRDCINQWFDGPEILHSGKFEEIKFDVSSRLKKVEEMVHSELKRKSLRDESDAKSVKSNELFVNISNEYLFQSSAEEEKILDKNIGSIIGISRYSSLNKLINLTSYILRFMKNIMSRFRNEELIKDTLSVEERDQAVDLWI